MTISAVVITRNEEKMIANCLETLRWCDEVIVVDNGSADRTTELAELHRATVIKLPNASLAELRNKGLALAKSDWILYVDADERITPRLKREITQVIRSDRVVAYAIPRNNIHYGRWMQHGGWQHDVVVRLFHRAELKEWAGEVHEHAVYDGETGRLREALVHLTHRSMVDGLQKTIEWTGIEAALMLAANHPRITTLRLFKVTLAELLKRLIFRRAWKDGIEGNIEAMVQAMNRFIVYERLWELQQKPSLEETYARIEKEINRLWENDRA